MPYFDCPACHVRFYSAASHAHLIACPTCDLRLVEADDPPAPEIVSARAVDVDRGEGAPV